MITQADDSSKRAAAWRRFRGISGGMTAAGCLVAAGVLIYLRAAGAEMPWNARLAIGLAVALSMAVAGVLMGLVFASARSGHDAEADRPEHGG